MNRLRLPTDALDKIHQVSDVLEELKDVHRKIDALEKIYPILDILQNVNTKLDTLLDAVDTGILETDTENAVTIPTSIDRLGHLHVLQDMLGMHEDRDHQALTDMFAEFGLGIDPQNDAWCGACIRYAICKAGFPDPGAAFHKASAWQNYGVEAKDAQAPGTIIVYYSHVSVRDEAGNEIGGNVSDSVKIMPAGANWFGTPIAYRDIDLNV